MTNLTALHFRSLIEKYKIQKEDAIVMCDYVTALETENCKLLSMCTNSHKVIIEKIEQSSSALTNSFKFAVNFDIAFTEFADSKNNTYDVFSYDEKTDSNKVNEIFIARSLFYVEKELRKLYNKNE
jgi:hypothetical protein